MSTSVRSEDIKPGDVLSLWYVHGGAVVVSVEPYTGPFDFICGIAHIANAGPISLEKGRTFELFGKVKP